MRAHSKPNTRKGDVRVLRSGEGLAGAPRVGHLYPPGVPRLAAPGSSSWGEGGSLATAAHAASAHEDRSGLRTKQRVGCV